MHLWYHGGNSLKNTGNSLTQCNVIIDGLPICEALKNENSLISILLQNGSNDSTYYSVKSDTSYVGNVA